MTIRRKVITLWRAITTERRRAWADRHGGLRLRRPYPGISLAISLATSELLREIKILLEILLPRARIKRKTTRARCDVASTDVRPSPACAREELNPPETPFQSGNHRALASFRQTCQHHRCLEFVHGRFPAACSQWGRVQRQARNIGWAPQRLERHRLARTKVGLVQLANGVAHLAQSGIERQHKRPLPGPDPERPGRIRQPGSRLPGMTDRLRGLLENLEQPLDALKVPPDEAALEIAMIGEDQGCERGNMSRRQRGAVADRVAIRRLAGNDRYARRAQIEFWPPAREQRNKKPARDRGSYRGLGRLRAVFQIASGLPDRRNRHDMRRTGRKQHRARRVAGGCDDADALLFCHCDTLLNQR